MRQSLLPSLLTSPSLPVPRVRRRLLVAVAALAMVSAPAAPALAASTAAPVSSAVASSTGASSAGAPAAGALLPETIPLTSPATAETGFQAEGIAARGLTAYAGSLATGTILRADLLTGATTTLVERADGPAVGLALDADGRLWVAGGPTGSARVYDTVTGELLADLHLADDALVAAGQGFVNDVTVTPDAAYLTNSFAPEHYRVPLGPGGAIGEPETVPLGGDFTFVPGGFNANGVVAAPYAGLLGAPVGDRDGRGGAALVVAQSTDPDGDGSALYVVDADTGDATRIVLTVAPTAEVDDTDDVRNADGLVLRGRTLYVVENQADRVARVRLSADLTRGTVVDRITDDDFAVPTTAALAAGGLYAVNARFGAEDPAAVTYEIVRAPRR